MSIEAPAQVIRTHLRVDGRPSTSGTPRSAAIVAFYAATAAFFAWGSLTRELTAPEARLALAAWETIAPHGQVMGYWAADVRIGPLLCAQAVAWLIGPDARGWPIVVHIPTLLAGLGTALIVARGVGSRCGERAALLSWLAVLNCLGMIDHSTALGFDALTVCALTAALDELLRRGSTWRAGTWLAIAFFMGGWPPVLLILVTSIALGRRSAYLSFGLLMPWTVAAAAWSFWALSAAPAAVWGESVLGPLRTPADWWAAPRVAVLALPWSPLVLLWLSKSVRNRLSDQQRRFVLGWSQAGAAASLVGSFVPGAGVAAVSMGVVVLALLGAIAASLALGSEINPRAVRASLILMVCLCLVWAAVAVPALSYLAVTVAYYRELAVVLSILALASLAFAVVGAWEVRRAWVIGAFLVVVVSLKAAHAGIYAVEWSYRLGQGPWGRAIGQWVPPRSRVYTFHAWPEHLAYATGRTVRQLVSPRWLEFVNEPSPHYVMLLASEFEHWPNDAPAIEKLRVFLDERGGERVLARTLSADAKPQETQEPARPAFSSSPLTPNRLASSDSTSFQAISR